MNSYAIFRQMLDKEYYYRTFYEANMGTGNLEQCKTISVYWYRVHVFRELLRRNPDNFNNYYMLMKAYKIDPEKGDYTEAEMNTIMKMIEGNGFYINQ